MNDNEEIWGDGFPFGNSPSGDKAVKCVSCKWEGTIKETHRRAYRSDPESWNSLGGREGEVYNCPKCGFSVYNNFWKVS